MAKHSLTAALAQAQRMQRTNQRHRQKVRGFENALIRKAAVASSAGLFGVLKRQGVSDEVGGVPWKLPVFVGATLIEALASSSVVTHFFGGLSDATMACYMQNAIANKTWVAGEGDELA